MSDTGWISELLANFQEEHIFVHKGSRTRLAPAHVLHIDVEDWLYATEVSARYGCRWCALWAEEVLPSKQGQTNINEEEEEEALFIVNTCYEKHGGYLILRTRVPHDDPTLPSQTPVYPAANRSERHAQDMFGLIFAGHPDNRRWTRHQAWPVNQYPLLKSFPIQGISLSATPEESTSAKTHSTVPHTRRWSRHQVQQPVVVPPPTPVSSKSSSTPPDSEYPFLQAQGEGVYEIPVGPVHAGIIEPGHFRFQVVGETVLNLEEHLGYVHKGIEKIAEGEDVQRVARLAGRVSGDSTIAHTWAACMAMERAAKMSVPARALMLRAIMAERERIANHLGDIGAICNDVGFSFAYYQFSRLREQWQRFNQQAFGHRFMMDCIIPGGVNKDIPDAAIAQHIEQLQHLHAEMHELEDILERHTGLEDRLATTGILVPETASKLGCLGYVGRASGQNYDLRRDSPYQPYNQFRFEVPVYQTGDVEARMQVRIDEIHISLHLLYQMLTQLPLSELCIPWKRPLAEAEGLGLVEGWRGEILVHVRFDAEGQVSRYYPRDPSWLNWPALELLIRDNIVPDFPVCNKSVNGSYSAHDL